MVVVSIALFIAVAALRDLTLCSIEKPVALCKFLIDKHSFERELVVDLLRMHRLDERGSDRDEPPLGVRRVELTKLPRRQRAHLNGGWLKAN